MTEGKRPGGLTALAVLNFVFGGFNLLGFLGMAVLMAFMNAAVAQGSEANDTQREMVQAWQEVGVTLFYVVLASAALSALLLIASGVGYLQQKKFLGRTLGNVYAVLGIAGSIVGAFAVSAEAGGGFNIGTIVGLVYPVLTLILLNTTFKEDFVR